MKPTPRQTFATQQSTRPGILPLYDSMTFLGDLRLCCHRCDNSRAGAEMKKLKIRKDRTPAMLRKLAKAESDARVTRRLLAIANALCGMSRAEAARAPAWTARR